MKNKQTAVEWLYNHLFPNQLDGFSEEEWGKIDKAFKQAKEIEKEQIIDAYHINPLETKYGNIGKQYYNQTYKQQTP